MSDVRLTLRNTDDGDVLVRAEGTDASAWAIEQQSLCGCKWESSDGEPYAIVVNAPHLPQAIAAECDLDENCIDTADWCPPVPPTLRNC